MGKVQPFVSMPETSVVVVCSCSHLSLPGKAELKKLGPPSLPLGALARSALALVGAKGPECVMRDTLSALNHMPITND